MAVAITLKQFLSARDISYETLRHAHSETSLETAEASHVPGDYLAKAVLLSDGKGGFLLAVLPATHTLDLEAVSNLLGQNVRMAGEDDMAELFSDCEVGAVPPVGGAYGLPVIWDDSFTEANDVYFEGGDHATLVHVSRRDFLDMMADARHATISRHI